MIGPIFQKYLFENYAFIVFTPLAPFLIRILINIWCIKKPDIIKDLPEDEQSSLLRFIYDKQFDNHINDESKCEKSCKLKEYIMSVRNEIKFPDKDENRKCNFSNDVFTKILKEIIMIDMKSNFDKLEIKLTKYDERLDESKIPDELYTIFKKYYINIVNSMSKLEDILDKEKVAFIQNYRDMIYDEALTLSGIEYYLNKKINEFKSLINLDKDEIKFKSNTYIMLLDRWLDIFNNNKSIHKIHIFPYSSNIFEEITIYEDICSIGEYYLIELIAPIVNKFDYSKKKKNLNKMSSGVLTRTGHLFLTNDLNYDFKNLYNKYSSHEEIKKIKFSVKATTNKKDLTIQIHEAAEKISKIIQSHK